MDHLKAKMLDIELDCEVKMASRKNTHSVESTACESVMHFVYSDSTEQPVTNYKDQVYELNQ